MKLSSKSILSPGHSREPPQMSLSSSFNRRLVTSGSIKGAGQASPMFPTVSRKRGSGFENHEPSSPKVTCIGQVRVKTKKQGKKMRARSKSFRRPQQNSVNPDLGRQKSQKRSSQSFQCQQQNWQQQQEEGLAHPHRNQRWVHLPTTICEALKGFGAELSCFFPCRSSCTREKEVKAEGRRSRWLVTVQEGDGDPSGREIELVMGEEEEDRTTERRHRRHVFEDIDIEKLKRDNLEGEEEEKEEEEEKGRVSICIPPKNALLLMRCRSDPVKMAALANRFWEPTIEKQDEHEPMEEEAEAEAEAETEAEINQVTEEQAEAEKEEDQDSNANANEQDRNFSGATFAEENDVAESSELSSTCARPASSEPQNNQVSAKWSTEEEEKGTAEEEDKESKERENGSKLEKESGSLPECLLLMMCEPKLSMEVSRETWVCTADFIRWLPPRPAGKTGGGDRQPMKKVAVDPKPPQAPPQLIQAGRSSCSAATVAGSNGCEPLVLTRCKSEPRGSSAAKLAPEACSWNNRKLVEPHLPAQLRLGAAGV